MYLPVWWQHLIDSWESTGSSEPVADWDLWGGDQVPAYHLYTCKPGQLLALYSFQKKPKFEQGNYPFTRDKTHTSMYRSEVKINEESLHSRWDTSERLTSFDNSRLVTGTYRQHFKYTTSGPQQFLICVRPHDVDQSLGSSTSKDD